MLPSFTHRARDAPFRACAPLSPRIRKCSSHSARAVPRTFITSLGFTPSAHDTHFCLRFRCRPQGLRARALIAARQGMQRHFSRTRGTAYVHHVAELRAPRSRRSFPRSLHQTPPPEPARAPPIRDPRAPGHAAATQTHFTHALAVRRTFTMSPSFTRPADDACSQFYLPSLAISLHSIARVIAISSLPRLLDPIVATAPETLVEPGSCNRFHTLNSRCRMARVFKIVQIRYSMRTGDSAGNSAHGSDMAHSPCRRASRGVLTELFDNSLASFRLVVATRGRWKMPIMQSLPPGQSRPYSPRGSPAPTGNRRTRIMQRQTVEKNWAAARARQPLRSRVGSRSVSGRVSRTFIASDSVLGIESRRADAPSMLC